MDAKPVRFLGDSLKKIRTFPEVARRTAGFQLGRVQRGLDPHDWKLMQTLGAGVREIRIREAGRAHRVVYVAKFEETIYVLHAFEKKSQKTPRSDVDKIRARYKEMLALRRIL